MREIKFRGKRLDNGEWVVGSLEVTHDLKTFMWLPIPPLSTIVQVDPETVGQYTGLKDGKGVEIFEGDILAPIVIGKRNRYVVRWHSEGAGFHIRPTNQREGGYSLYVNSRGYSPHEVVENVHDNPELLRTSEEGDSDE